MKNMFIIRIAGGLVMTALITGCVAQKGITFGQFVRPAENIDIIKLYKLPEKTITFNEKILLLPVIGKNIPKDTLKELSIRLQNELKNYSKSQFIIVEKDDELGKYTEEENILLIGNLLNFNEISKLGKIFNAPYVLCVNVTEYRPYPPQVLSFNFTLIETSTAKPAAEIGAVFNAAEQEVVIALEKHLQGRSARKYSTNNLDIMLNSPSEYSSFALAYCCKNISREIWKKKFKIRTTEGDLNENIF